MTGKLPAYIKYLILSVLILSGFSTAVYSQKKINGIINKYAHVTAIGTDNVTVADEAQFDQFIAGDTVLLIQMKGVKVYTFEDNSFGTSFGSFGPAGAHEFVTILSVDDATNKIVFRNNIVNTTFNLVGDIQIIKVPSYNFAKVDDSDLTCQPWDSTTKTGGVLAAIIGRTLTLNTNINVSGKGLKGGITSLGIGACVGSNVLRFDKYSFKADSTNSGYKGESVAVTTPSPFPTFAKGKGALFTGGGGGNGRFSGGGGGGSYGKGGRGGLEKPDCSSPVDGGLPGVQIKFTGVAGGLFLGGGGGSSTYLAGSVATAGGNGGGIVILVCDTLKGNGKSILAEGASVTATASGNAGAGGGGGGGSVALYLQSFTSNLVTSALTISANGGKGGDNAPLVNDFGEGGGGGGGLIKTSNTTTPANVVKTITGGARGNRFGSETSAAGQPGESLTTYVPILNGFLFNSIRSSVTGNQIDSICSNVIPKPITGTSPVGGSGTYTYLWQKKYDATGAVSNIPSSNVKDFVPTTTESDTVFFRRIVKDDVTLLTDTSKWVEIRVQPAIQGNLVGKDTTICYSQNPLPLIALNSGPTKGNGVYTYQWIQNPNNTDWSAPSNAAGTSTTPQYDPPALTATTFYKRVVTSGRCINYSAATTITVLPLIAGNITARPDSVICEGMLFNNLSASAASGGDNTYVYQWQESADKISWNQSPNINTTSTYTPDTATFAVTEQRYYRRVVWSGPDSVCRSNSLPILMTRWHYIENNLISKDTTICSGSVPPAITGTTPLKGSGIYTYVWQDSSEAVSWTDRSTSISPFAPPALSDTTWYRRIVRSAKCADTSKLLVINVHKPILNNVIFLKSGSGPDTTICSSAIPNKIMGAVPTGGTDIPGDYAYSWYYSTDNFGSSNVAVSTGGTLRDYQPVALSTTTWFRRKTISGKCETFSNAIRVIVLPPITNNAITSDQTVCKGTVPAQLTGPVPNGGDPGLITYYWEQSADGGTTWTIAAGTSGQQNYTPPALSVPMKYKRTVKSGLYDCCIVISNIISIGIHQLPTATITSVADTTICNGQTVKLRVTLTGAAGWTLGYNENSTAVTPVSGITSTTFTISRVPDGAASSSSVFNYTITSLKDNNNCNAIVAGMTGSRKATVYRVPVANAGPATAEVCGPVYQLAALPSDGTGTWTWKATTPVLVPFPTAYNSKVIVDSSFTEASKTYSFYWEELNWNCKAKDSVKVTFFNRIDSVNLGDDIDVQTEDNQVYLKAGPVKAFESGLWSVVSGNGDFDSQTSPEVTVRNVTEKENIYKWTVTNGACVLADEIAVSINPIVVPQGVSPNGDDQNDVLKIKGVDLTAHPDGSPVNQIADLKIINSTGAIVFSTSSRNVNDWKDWDGKNSAGIELPEGTYYYHLRIEYIDTHKIFTDDGFVILKRQ